MEKLKNYVGGKWIDPENSGYLHLALISINIISL